ncbi:MAG: Na/Pi cotransporter family protein [Clostridiales bacterium]|nr:Na/Pi cotransporter family protein [Clostridiales bacterium]
MDISNVLMLLGGVALFLFGMTVMGEALKKVAGNKLETILYKLSSTPIKGILLGTFVTAVIQSSSATTVMVVGFVNSGMMKVMQAIGVIMGALIGTSVTGWVLTLSYMESGSGIASLLSTATLTAVVAIIGIVLRMFCKAKTKRNIGEILLGFAVLMYGMTAMSGAVSPLKESQAFKDAISSFSNPILGILLGAVITAVLQSASASVGILQALSVTGAIHFSTAYPIILGIGIGAAVPVLLSAIGANTNGKRTAVIYLLTDLLGAIIWGIIFYSVNAFVHFDFMHHIMNPVSIALVNTVFRILTVAVLFPFIKLIEKMICRIIPSNADDEDDLANIEKLEERFLMYPPIAIEHSKMVLFAMADKTRKNVFRAMHLFEDFDTSKYDKVKTKEDAIDKYEDKLGTYLVKLTGADMSDAETKEASLVLHTISDFERIGDHAVNIAELAQELHDKKLVFSEGAKQELEVLFKAVIEIVDKSFHSFVEGDLERAHRVEPHREIITSLCAELKLRHIKRVQKGECGLELGFIFNDLLMNLERISGHCSNIAIAMIELQDASYQTHEYENTVHEMKTESYKKYLEKYEARYEIK